MSALVTRLRREPLVWFLLAGILLFGVQSLVGGDAAGGTSRTIRVERGDLLQFMQLRARSFNETEAGKLLDRMPPADVSALVADMVREEAMYREALRLGLDRSDYVMRRRMVQSLEFLADNADADQPQPGHAELARYFEAHRARYADAPSVTFSHVFFDAEDRGPDEARKLAMRALGQLNAAPASAESALGDRFLYMRNYAQQGAGLIEDHFGKPFASDLFRLKADQDHWQGPLQSVHGFHLVKVIAADKGRNLTFAQARALVADDFAKDAAQRRREAFAAGLLKQYRVKVGGDVEALMAPAR